MARYRILGTKYNIKHDRKKRSCTSLGPVKTCQDGIMCARNILGQTPVSDKGPEKVGQLPDLDANLTPGEGEKERKKGG